MIKNKTKLKFYNNYSYLIIKQNWKNVNGNLRVYTKEILDISRCIVFIIVVCYNVFYESNVEKEVRRKDMHIVLIEPEIPQNAGNIARTCAVTDTVLHLIKPLGFSVEDKYLKRAGLDYWNFLDIRYYENFKDFLSKNPNARLIMATTKAKKVYTEVSYLEEDFFVFGKESAGIPEEILLEYPETSVRIPMLDVARSLNLSNSVAIIIYEALRQQNFKGLLKEGQLHHHKW